MTIIRCGNGLEVMRGPRVAQSRKDKKRLYLLGDLPALTWTFGTLPLTAFVILGKSLNLHVM